MPTAYRTEMFGQVLRAAAGKRADNGEFSMTRLQVQRYHTDGIDWRSGRPACAIRLSDVYN